jgi:hypothetical protein
MTALQELIQYLGASNPMDYSYFLEKEKEQIIESFDNGSYVGTYSIDKDGEDYYIETFNKKIK